MTSFTTRRESPAYWTITAHHPELSELDGYQYVLAQWDCWWRCHTPWADPKTSPTFTTREEARQYAKLCFAELEQAALEDLAWQARGS